MLLANYGSDSDSDSGPSSPPPRATAAAQPAPSASGAKAKKRKGPVKITLDLPKAAGEEEKSTKKGQEEEDEDQGPRLAKRKLGAGGAGSSSLLGMLPPPKRKTIIKAEAPGLAVNKSMAAKPKLPSAFEDDTPSIVPSTVKRKKEEELDLFGLCECIMRSLTSAEPAPKKPALPTTSAVPKNVSAAPPVADFVPPPPTASDPYPGYYQLPSGQWAAYDPEYYSSFFASTNTSLEAEEENRAGRVGRHWKDLDDGRAAVIELDAADTLAEGKKLREAQARKAKPQYQVNEFQYNPIGQTKGLATERHQLTSLLASAYSQREELEARIAENKKNTRLAQAKYGF